MDNYSLSDIGAVAGGNGFGGNSAWVLIILFALIFGNGGFFGNNNGRYATADDVQRATDFQALERQNNEGVAATRQAAYDVTSSVKDANYNTLGEIRDLQAETGRGFNFLNSQVAAGFAGMQSCCCEIQRGIDSVNYNGAINTASINANTTAQTQKILDAMAQSKIESLQAQVSELKTQNMFCGIPRINPYGYGVYPYGNSCGCNCGNI